MCKIVRENVHTPKTGAVCTCFGRMNIQRKRPCDYFRKLHLLQFRRSADMPGLEKGQSEKCKKREETKKTYKIKIKGETTQVKSVVHFAARRYAYSAAYAIARCLSVCTSVRLSRSCSPLKRVNLFSNFFPPSDLIDPPFYFFP